MSAHLTAREQRGSRSVRADRYAAGARILPELGSIELAALTAKRLRDWHQGLAAVPKPRRTDPGALARRVVAVETTDPETVRARRATVNRVCSRS